MNPVYKYDMVNKVRIETEVKRAVDEIKKAHSSASPYRIEMICDQLLKIGTWIQDIENRLHDIELYGTEEENE